MIDDLIDSEARAVLGRCFGSDFRRTRWHRGPLARLLTTMAGVAGITLGRRVLLSRPALARLERQPGEPLRLIAHELAHVVQYRSLGTMRFLVWYCGEYLLFRWRGMDHQQAYWSLTLERQARLVAELVAEWSAAPRAAEGGRD